MNTTMPTSDIKTIYSFKLKNLLVLKGFKPLMETDNPRIEGFKCQVFEASPAFLEAFDEIMSKGGSNNDK